MNTQEFAMNTNTSVLSFQDHHFDIVDIYGEPWLRGYQIGNALGYSDGAVAIGKLYARNADEFDDTMTQVISLPDLSKQTAYAAQELDLQSASPGQNLSTQIEDTDRNLRPQIEDAAQELNPQFGDAGGNLDYQTGNPGQNLSTQAGDADRDLPPQIAGAAQKLGLQSASAGQNRQVRIFSLRGCHLLGMLAKTETAKAFRRWVLDVLQEYTRSARAAAKAVISKEQKQQLAAEVHILSERTGEPQQAVYARLFGHFGVRSSAHIRARDFETALAFLQDPPLPERWMPQLSEDDVLYLRRFHSDTVVRGICDKNRHLINARRLAAQGLPAFGEV